MSLVLLTVMTLWVNGNFSGQPKLLNCGFASLNEICKSTLPDFSKYTNSVQKKAAFFDYLYPLILAENQKILAERDFLESSQPSRLTVDICKKYRADCEDLDNRKINTLLNRVDVIPPSMVMAQAANESAWGTSRFARDANNLFGQWCFSKGCGLIPASRSQGSTHEVKKFSSPQDSIRAYLLNLNTSGAYRQIRNLRAIARSASENPTGYQLAQGLSKYSQRGQAYVKEIRDLISGNKLSQNYDRKFWEELSQQP